MSRTRVAVAWGMIAALVVALVLVLLAQRGDRAPVAVPTVPPDVRASVTPSPVVTDAGPPPLGTDPDDPVAGYRAIVAYENWLRQHPDPALVAEIHDVDCPCKATFEEFLAYFVDYDATYEGGLSTVSQIEIGGSTETVWLLSVTNSGQPRIWRVNGDDVRRRDGWSDAVHQVGVIFDEGRWKLLTVRVIEKGTAIPVTGGELG